MAKGQISLLLVTVFCFSLYVDAALSVDPVPPLQWLRLDTLLKGSTSPGGLKDASMGYSEERRTLIIFGGEASSTVPQGQTYLLNLESLTWSTPSPPVTLQQTPPARSAAVSGVDSAASNRDGFIVLGGKGADGAALSDVWEFDFTNQFWAEVTISPGGPSARWGSSGGIDTRVPPVSDPVLPGPNNTLWLWGGENGQSSFSDLWRLNISGTLSSNMPNSAVGSWEHLPLANLPETVGQGGGVSGDQIVFSGGCNTTSFSGDACALQDTYIINAGANGATESAALKCPAPRLSPTVVPNGNVVSVTFSNQMFLLLGTFNTSLWNDSGGLEAGEVAVLDTNSQSWTRIIPSGDPGTSGTPSFPSPRDGAVAVMSPLSLVGQSRTSSSDIIVFGGRDMDGNYLSELWLLRAYNGSVTPTDPKWSGFGNGQLQTGVDANGAGVENTFISSCASASAIAGSGIPTSSSSSSKSTSTSTSSSGSDSGSSGDNDGTPSTSLLNTSLVHKLSAPLSVALLMPSFLLFRLTSPSFNSSQSGAWPHAWYYASALLGLAGYALGIAGIATSFTTISSIDASRPPPLSTVHGRAGLALFISLYGLVPVVAILLASTRHVLASATAETRKRADSDLTEKDRLPRSIHSPSPPASTRRRTHSWGPSSWRKVREDSLSIDSGSAEMGDSFNSAPGQRGFEVLNRPARTRRASGSRLGVPLTHMSQHAGSHSLGDLDWLNRRRSLTAVGELDLNQTTAAVPPPSTPGTLLEPPAAAPPPNMPPPSSVLLRLFFHASLLGLCVFCLVALWFKAPRSTFGVFLAWTVAFYVILLSSGWRGKPDRSTLSLLLDRLRTAPPAIAPRPSVSDTLPETDENVTFPYIHHRPTYRRALLSDATGPQGTDTEEEDDDRAEDEMRRRDISIVTSYPKRQLRITNPS